ncbi:unnamed protein product [Thlaspi arvense]|uniref:Uncharacterized protein n=1 Tax=Thlaspi arvense TaxID=13288 RepID=A0AAU9SQV2_THLAR|nr:unnamed protein product [Thlaspi arvense]
MTICVDSIHHEVKPLFGCLVETRVQQDNYSGIVSSALPGWSIFNNYDYHRLGHIWFCWSGAVVVTFLHKSTQIITSAIQVVGTGEDFICYVVYKSNFEAERRDLWRIYEQLKPINEYYRGYDQHTNQVGMRYFQNLVMGCNLVDLTHIYTIFTWWNKRQCDPIEKTLDQFLINGTWVITDHVRCVIYLSQLVSKRREQPPLHHSRAALYKSCGNRTKHIPVICQTVLIVLMRSYVCVRQRCYRIHQRIL